MWDWSFFFGLVVRGVRWSRWRGTESLEVLTVKSYVYRKSRDLHLSKQRSSLVGFCQGAANTNASRNNSTFHPIPFHLLPRALHSVKARQNCMPHLFNGPYLVYNLILVFTLWSRSGKESFSYGVQVKSGNGTLDWFSLSGFEILDQIRFALKLEQFQKKKDETRGIIYNAVLGIY